MNAKAKGTRNEHRTMALLEASGFRVTRSGASLGCFDIIGISHSGVALVQVKTNRWPDHVEMETIRDFPCPPNAVKLVHRWDDRKRSPLVKEVS
jgi:Holliday junction resolvase